MIKITRSACPAILRSKKLEWTTDAKTEITATGKLSDRANRRYRSTTIKRALLKDSHNKCMYCELSITAGAYGDVEHIKPKVRYVDEMYEWTNLGIACDVCNTNKSSEYDESLPFVNPYNEQPEDFFEAQGTYVLHRPGNRRGRVTIDVLDLNRPELLEKRSVTLKRLRELLDTYTLETSPLLKEAQRRALELQCQDDVEFAFIARAATHPYV